jgi:hypothetical protein
MTSLDLYQKILIKINKNDINKNIKLPKSKFVLIFNEFQRKYADGVKENENNSKNIFSIKELLVLDAELEKVNSFNNKDVFKLPDDFSEYDTSYSYATKGLCKSILYNNSINPSNLTVFLQDNNNKPSFEYQETIVVQDSDNLSVYTDGFTIDKVYLNYYKEPREIDIEGYIRIDGTDSTNIDPELSDSDLDKILDLCAVEITRNYEDVNTFQLAQTRITK